MSFIFDDWNTNNNYNEPWDVILDPNQPEAGDERPDPNQREPMDERLDPNRREPMDENPVWNENIPNNPLMALLGVQTNNNGNIPKAQQKNVKNQYPALSNIFGTKAQSGFMSLDGDDGGDDGSDGGDDKPVYPDDDGTIHGGVEYPEGYPEDPEDPEGYPEPGDPSDPSRTKYPQANYFNPFGTILNAVLSQTLGITFNSAQKAAYYRGNDQTHSSDYKDSVQQLNTSINALNETHKIQQTNLNKILNKVTDAKTQEDYTQNLRTYTQLKEQAQSTQNLATRIQYAADNHDYQNVAVEVQNYTVPDQSTTAAVPAPTLSDLDQNDWRYEHNPQLQAGLEKAFGSSSDTPVQHYFQPQTQNYNTVPVQNYYPEPQAPEHNFGTSDFPMFHLGVAIDNATVPIETTTSIPTSPKPETIAETGEVISASATITDFMERVNTIPEIDPNVIKQAFATFQGPTGQKIQADLEKTLQAGIEKIAQECVDGAKAFKLATEISEKVAPILTFAYIAQQFIQGFQKGGISDGAWRGIAAIAESLIATAVFGALIGTELTILPAATITLFASLVIDYLFEQVLNHFKL